MDIADLWEAMRCPCPDIKKTAAIAKALDGIVPGTHVSAAGAGRLAIVWDESVSSEAVKNLRNLARALAANPPEPGEPAAPKSPLIHPLKNHKAQEIAHKVDNSVPGITIMPIPNDADDVLVVAWEKDSLAAAVPGLLKVIDGLDVADTVGTASSHIIKLYNNRHASDIAKLLNNSLGGAQKIGVAPQGDDILILTGSSPGSEGAIDELKRYVAILDLPRPEIAMNLWSVQISAGQVSDINYQASQIRRIVNAYNSVLTESYDRGWRVFTNLKKRAGTAWLDDSFSGYVGKRFIACSPFYKTKDGDQQLCFKEDSAEEAEKVEKAEKTGPTREFLHACEKGKYCLGYTFAFDPGKASLTNLLFALAAADQPDPVAAKVVECMESNDPGCSAEAAKVLAPVEKQSRLLPSPKPPCKFVLENEQNCEVNATEKSTEKLPGEVQNDCEDSDSVDYKKDLPKPTTDRAPGTLHLECFKSELHNVFASARKTGLLRAAIADFLFHYKMSVEYPHDFVAYDLSHSADTLDSYFHPLLAAYNRDLAALLRFLQEEKVFVNKKEDFVSEGITSVSVISGNPASVDAKTANAFDSVTPFTFTEFLNQLKKAETNTPLLLKGNLTADEANALVAAFNVQKPTTVNIGRDLSLNATAFSLATGAAADLKVSMASKDDGQPQQTFQDSKNDINPSRVAQQTVDTIVRVESTRLFELSSLSARLSYRGNAVPVPVLGELPVVGPAFRWPGKVHTKFHRTFAIISAVVVPNASDLAEGMPFTGDRMLAIPKIQIESCQEPLPSKCGLSSACARVAKKCPDPPARQQEVGTEPSSFSNRVHAKTLALDSLRELPPQVREFHKEKVRCLISNNSDERCSTLKLDDFPEDGSPADRNTEEP